MLIDNSNLGATKIGIIGAGRLGKALAWCLDTRGFNIHAAASRTDEEAQSLARKTNHCLVVNPQQVADTCDLIFITTPDDSIAPTAESIKWREKTGVVHCSGATDVTALSKAASDGASIGGFHPLQTFGDPEAAALTLPGCVITIEANSELNDALCAIAVRLGCKINLLPAGARGSYHAAAAYAGQFLNVLLAEAVRVWKSWGGSEDAALQALVPLMRGTVSSIETAGVARGMPGPVSRGDTGTVRKHVKSLSEIDEGAASFYRELAVRSVPLAQQAGGISEKTAAEILQILGK
jgi:predicted short-subunit dehydrogenase-like oxidoreductase (DUF2520 family)